MEFYLLVILGLIVAVVALIRWDNARMTKQAEREAKSQRPFPDDPRKMIWKGEVRPYVRNPDDYSG
jgi:hypothetical protein